MAGPSAPGSVDVRGVSRRFGSLEVLRDVSLELGPGTLAGLIGANGSGKTTLLRILAGVLAPDSGEVRVAGAPPGRGLSGFAPPGDRGLYWRLTGRQNLEFFARLGRRSPRDTAWVAEALGATELLGKRMGTASTGQRRRLAIARAFAGAAPVVLIDEPYADLDEAGCAGVDEVCRRWCEDGGVVVYAAPAAGEGPEPGVRVSIEGGAIRAAA